MGFLRQLTPRTLVGRIFSLYAATLLVMTLLGLALFYRYQFSQQVAEEIVTAEVVMNVAAPNVADSVVIGDYDTIAKTLARAIENSPFAVASFIDTDGGVIKAENRRRVRWVAPHWLVASVEERLFDVNHNVRVGGKDYGVMRMSFDVDAVAGKLWEVFALALGLATSALLLGIGCLWWPLKRWLGNFDRVRVRESDILSGSVDVADLLDSDAPAEIRHTFSILSNAATRLVAQRAEAAVTLNAIADGVLSIDSQARLVNGNPAALMILGVAMQEIKGRSVFEVLPDVVLPSDAAMGWKMQRMELAASQGRPTMLDVTISAIRAGDDELSGYVLALRDVTQQHNADQQLRTELQTRKRALGALHRLVISLDHGGGAHGVAQDESDDLDVLVERVAGLILERENSRRALDNQKFALDQHAIVSITDLQGNINYANDRFCAISGYSREELIGVNHRIVKSGMHDASVFQDLWRTVTAGQVWRGEVCNRAKNGQLYWVSATIVPLMGADGLPEQYIGIRTDITGRKAVETKLAEQLRFVEVLLDATPTAIYLKDLQGRYLRFNRAFEELFGIERDQWLGKNVFDLVPGDAAAMMHAKDSELFAAGTVQTYEASFTNRRTGAVREGLYWKAPVTNVQGEITGLVGTILDVTDRNRMAQELRDSKQKAEAASQAKSDFLANMSHEIRTPMNGVIGMTDLALDTDLAPVQREYLQTVRSSAQSLMVILNDILDFSKIEAGKLNIEETEFSLPEFLRETLRSLQARADKKGLQLDLQLGDGLPPLAIGDPVRIRQVLTNLCDNAIKFTAQGTVSVLVTPEPLPGGAGTFGLRLAVRDSGIGIPPEKQESIFEAFSQADTSTTRKFGGTGLGLTICSRLVGLMGGRIWVESTPGQGSVFYFTVQLGSVASRGQSSPTSLVSDIPAAPIQVGLKILLVEDHPVNQKLATTLLTKWGHVVTVAHHGQEAVDLYPKEPWDLVLMDMQMPVMGGLEATQLIRKMEMERNDGKRVPIIAMTANAMESDRQACLDAGMDDFVAKPFNVATVRAAMARVIPALVA
jgi:hypothetical protein